MEKVCVLVEERARDREGRRWVAAHRDVSSP